MAESPGDLFLAHRTLIESVIRFVCRRRGLRGETADEFAADVRLRLIESNCDAIRRFEGRSSLQTYLTVVIERLALDFQAARWGRWRPSAVARAHGPAGVRLEQLVVRDARPIPDALTIVESELGPVDREALGALAARFPLRVRRRYVGEELLEAVAVEAPDAERLLVQSDEAERFDRVTARLAQLLQDLDPSERLVLQLRFEQGMKVADIARLQQVDQKRLYRRIQDVLARLRAMLESEGLDASMLRAMFVDLDPDGPRREAARPVRLYEGNTP